MPRNGSGTYTLPAGNPVEPGTVIESNWANATLEDIADEITDSLSRTGEGGMLAPFRLADGASATPGISWLNETSSGFYRAGSGEMWGTILGVPVFQYTINGVMVPSGRTFTAQGNATIGGTLGVTGAVTMSSTLAVTGVITATGGVNGNITSSNVTITGGTINGTPVGGTTRATGAFTTLSANAGITGDLTGNVTGNVTGNAGTVTNGVYTVGSQTIGGTKTFSTTIVGSISGNAGTVTNGVYTTGSYADPAWITSLAGSKVTGNITGNAANVTGTVAVANGGTGATTTAGARTSLDVPSTTGSGATGTWNIDILGNAGTATNGVVTTGSYANPTWITSLAGSKITGNITGNAANVTGTVAVANGGTGQTTYTNGQLLIGNASGSLTKATITAGSGISVTNGDGAITITATAGGGTVTSVDVSGGTTGLTTSGGPITGSGTITLGGTLAVANGGTGGATAETARTNLLPSYTSNANKVLTVNAGGTDVEWVTPAAGGITMGKAIAAALIFG